MSNSLAKTIVDDVASMLTGSSFLAIANDIGNVIHDSIEEGNELAENPDGSNRQDLSPFYAEEKRMRLKRDVADFDFTGRAKESLMYNTDEDGLSFFHGNAEADEYMYDHEFGNNGMPERRQFAVESDMSGARQQGVTQHIEVIIEEHLNTDRVIHVTK